MLHISNEMKEWLLLTYPLNTCLQGNESKKWRQPLFFFSWYYASIHEVFTYCQNINTISATSETCASSVVKWELQKFASLFLQSGCEERVKEFIQIISWVSESEAVGRAKLRKDSLGTHWYHYACRMNLVFCLVFKLRHLSFQKKSLKGFSASLWCLFDRSQVGNASVLETLLRNEFDNFMFWSLFWSKLFYDHLLTTRFFNLETQKDFLGAVWCLHQKVNFGTCNKLSIELCLQKKLLFNDTKMLHY